MPLISALGRLREVGCYEIKASLSYKVSSRLAWSMKWDCLKWRVVGSWISVQVLCVTVWPLVACWGLPIHLSGFKGLHSTQKIYAIKLNIPTYVENPLLLKCYSVTLHYNNLVEIHDLWSFCVLILLKFPTLYTILLSSEMYTALRLMYIYCESKHELLFLLLNDIYQGLAYEVWNINFT